MKIIISVLLLAAAATGIVLAKGGPPINEICPVKGNAARVIFRVFTDQGTVAFCCVDCMEDYQKNPNRYPVTKKKE